MSIKFELPNTSGFTSDDITVTSMTVTSSFVLDGYQIDLSTPPTTNQILKYNGTKFVAANETGGGSANIGSPVSGGTAGSVLFVDGSNNLGQNNTNFNWNVSNSYLSLKTSSSGLGPIYLYTGATDTYSALGFHDSSATFKGYVGYGNSTVAVTHLRSVNMLYSTGPDWIFANGTNAKVTIGMSDNSTYMQMINGGSASVSAGNTGRLRYNSSTQHFEISENGGSYTQLGVGSISGTFTSTKIPYATGTTTLADSGLTWDNTDQYLGVGQAAPAAKLDVLQANATSGNPVAFNITAGTHTTLPASTEVVDVNVNLNHTVQLNSGAVASQRAFIISAPTYAFTGASTITTAATLAVTNAPQPGTNATITKAYSIWAQAGIAAFDGHIKVDGYTIDLSAGALTNQVLQYNGTSFVAATASSAVSSVSNSDSTLTISPTTGAVVASLNLGHANTWTAKQTFSAHIAVDGYTVDLSAGATTGQILQYNGTSFVAAANSASVSIGANIGSGTSKSILYLDGSSNLAQDNSNFAWDFTNHRLGIGTNTPSVKIHIIDNDASLAQMYLRNNNASGVSQMELYNNSGTFKLAVGASNSGGDTYVYSGASTDFSIQRNNGAAVTTFKSSGNVGFGQTSPSNPLSVNGAASFGTYSATAAPSNGLIVSGTVGIGTSSPASTYAMTVQGPSAGEGIKLTNTTTNSHADICFFDSSGTQKGGMGYANSAVGNSFASLNFFYTPNIDWVMSDATTNFFRWYTGSSAIGFEMSNGSSATASGSNKGKILYNSTSQLFQVSHNGGSYLDNIAGNLTATRIPFASAAGTLTDDSNLNWDNTNKRLGIGTTPGNFGLNVHSSNSGDVNVVIENTSSSGFSGISWKDSSDSQKGSVGYGNASVSLTYAQNALFSYSDATGNAPWIWMTATSRLMSFYASTAGNLNIGTSTSDPSIKLNIEAESSSAGIGLGNGSSLSVSASNTGRIRYNSSAQHFEISENGGSYTQMVSSGSTVTEKANASSTQVTTTSATDIVSFTPASQGNFQVSAYYRVVTATSNITLVVTWTDDTGAQTQTLVATATSTPVGSYVLQPIYINATTGSAIKVTATTGTANNLYVSATIIGIS